jgi:hypothetical protein
VKKRVFVFTENGDSLKIHGQFDKPQEALAWLKDVAPSGTYHIGTMLRGDVVVTREKVEQSSISGGRLYRERKPKATAPQADA